MKSDGKPPRGKDVRPVPGGIQGRAGAAPAKRGDQKRPLDKAPRPDTGGRGGGNSN